MATYPDPENTMNNPRRMVRCIFRIGIRWQIESLRPAQKAKSKEEVEEGFSIHALLLKKRRF